MYDMAFGGRFSKPLRSRSAQASQIVRQALIGALIQVGQAFLDTGFLGSPVQRIEDRGHADA